MMIKIKIKILRKFFFETTKLLKKYKIIEMMNKCIDKNNEELHKIKIKEIADVMVGRDTSPEKKQELIKKRNV